MNPHEICMLGMTMYLGGSESDVRWPLFASFFGYQKQQYRVHMR